MRSLSFAVAATIAFGALAPAADAATVVIDDDLALVVEGAGGHATTFTTSSTATTITVTLSGSAETITSAAPSGCVLDGTTTLVCTAPFGWQDFEVKGGDLGDTINLGVSSMSEAASGGEGDDTITSTGTEQSEVDDLNGDAGADTITAAGAGDIEANGGDGDDTIESGAGDDELRGGLGNDTLKGGAGNDDLIAGDAFPDDLGQVSPDSLDGGPGDDYLFPGWGADDVRGGDGDDVVDGRLDIPNATAGPFYAKLAVSLDDVANDGAQAPAGQQTGNWHSGLETVIAGDNDDTIIGNDAPNTLIGWLGSDTITGGGGADVIYGDVNPLLFSGDAQDGGDTINSRDGGPDIVRCSGGSDSVVGDSIDGLDQCESTDLAPPPGPGPIVPLPPGPAPAVDQTPPVTRTGAAASRTFKGWKKSDLAKSRGVSYPVTTDEPATITCEALATASGGRISKVGDVVIGEGKLARGTGARSCRIRIGAKYRKQVRRLKRLRVRVVATDAAGKRRESTATVRLLT